MIPFTPFYVKESNMLFYFIFLRKQHENNLRKCAFFCFLVLTTNCVSSIICEYVYIELSVSGFNVKPYYIFLEFMEVRILANIKSAKKRINVIEKKTLRNKMIRSKVKTVIKKVEAAIAAGDKAAAQQALVVATSEINKAASKGIYHKNNAARKVSRLAVAVNKMA